MPGVVIDVTKELTHGPGLDRKPIGLGTTVLRLIDFPVKSFRPIHVLVPNCQSTNKILTYLLKNINDCKSILV